MLIITLLLSCQPPQSTDNKSGIAPDDDMDGFGEDVDCADDDPDVNPAAEEICDGVDNNCDGLVDEGVTTDYLPDADGDGFADPDAEPVTSCERPEGHLPTSTATDCDDTDPLTYPGANEYCDGIDNDCDGLPDPTSCRPLASADIVIHGAADDHRLGSLVAGIGDVTGDGTPDVLLGAPGADPAGNETGLAYIFAGPLGPSDTLEQAIATIAGDSLGDRIGTSADGSGDFDGDGTTDVVVGGWGDPTFGAEAGSAMVFLGPLSGALNPDQAYFTALGSSAGDAAGLAVAMLGDTNSNGRSEMAVGAPNVDLNSGADINAGAVYIFSGGATGERRTDAAAATILGEAAGDYLGQAIASAGDMDGDGTMDLIVSAPNASVAGVEAGRVAIFAGPVSGAYTISDATGLFDGENAGEHAGGAVAPAGDVNSDGYADLLIGAPDQSDGGRGAGAAYIVHGPVSGVQSLGEAAGMIIGRLAWDHAGNSVAAVGDSTGDGEIDFLIGAYIEDSGALNAGAAFLVSGPVSGVRYLTEADAGFIGEAESDLAGWSVAAPGDLDGDGQGDVLIGAPQTDISGDNAGSAYILYARGF